MDDEFTDAELDEMLDRLAPEHRADLLSLPLDRFAANRNDALRIVLGSSSRQGFHLQPYPQRPVKVFVEPPPSDFNGPVELYRYTLAPGRPFEFVVTARNILVTNRAEQARAMAVGGRPTMTASLDLIKAKAAQRQAAGVQAAHKAPEARWLAAWLAETHPDLPQPKANTVRNQCLGNYRRPS